MSERLDVRRMLLRRAWAESKGLGALRKGGAVWAVANDAGDGFLDVPAKHGMSVVEFPAGVPARVIVAACEATASGDAEEATDER